MRKIEKQDIGSNGGNPDPLICAMQQAKLLDLGFARRLMREQPQIGAGRMARALACGIRTAHAILSGCHWQQNSERVEIFNTLNKCAIPTDTGEPDEETLKRFGPDGERRRLNDAKLKRSKNKRLREVVAEIQADPSTKALAQRMAIMKRTKPPMKLDTSYFQTQVDETIWRILRELDDVKVAGMTGRELASAAATLLEKRALLRGEPTQIVRTENRGSLEKVGELLLAEMARRGRKLPTLKEIA